MKKNTGICFEKKKNLTNDSYWETLLLSIPSVNRWETQAQGRDESRATQRLSDNVTIGCQVSSIPPASLPIRQTAFWSSDVVVPALIYEDEHLSGYFQLPVSAHKASFTCPMLSMGASVDPLVPSPVFITKGKVSGQGGPPQQSWTHILGSSQLCLCWSKFLWLLNGI